MMAMHTLPAIPNIRYVQRKLASRLLTIVQENMQRSTHLHQAWLQYEAHNLEVIARSFTAPTPRFEHKSMRPALITKTELHEFGTGLIARCLGSDFEKLDHRKSPRIPNGDLLMMDRVVEITARRGDFSMPASIVTEYEVRPDAWYLRENSYPGIPLGVLLEIALQPCGVLSAYLGTSLLLPPEVNIFRNLDGSMQVFSELELSGKTITTRAALLSSAAVGGMTIQSYAFDVNCEGCRIASGESSFGYFSQPIMEKQSGLDVGKIIPPPTLRQKGSVDGKTIATLDEKLHLALIDQLELDENGGRYGLGLLRGEKLLTGNEWFYANHFYQDPVMPGSLGLEAIIQTVWKYMEYVQGWKAAAVPILSFMHEGALVWKYRGQVIPANRHIVIEVHFKKKSSADDKIMVVVDADFWIDGLRIYAFSDISMHCRKVKRL